MNYRKIEYYFSYENRLFSSKCTADGFFLKISIKLNLNHNSTTFLELLTLNILNKNNAISMMILKLIIVPNYY